MRAAQNRARQQADANGAATVRNSPAPKAGCFPTHFEERILYACFGPLEDAWRELKPLMTSFKPGDLKSTSLSLLSLLYLRWDDFFLQEAKRNPQSEALLDRGRQVSMATWAASMRLRPHMLALLGACNQTGIEPLLLKGAALIAGYYSNASLRPMCDFDLLVHEQDLERAIELLQQLNWRADGDKPIADILRQRRVGHAWQFSLPDHQSCDLHWRPVLRCHAPQVTAFFWETAETVSIDRQTAMIPSVTALLFHVCIHGLQWSWTGHTRWVADALTLLNSGRPVDWPALTRLGCEANMTVRLRAALAYLAVRFHAPVPQSVLDELAGVASPCWERREAVILLKECPLGIRDSLTWHLSHFRRIRPFDEQWRKAPFWFAFMSYLRTFLEAEDWSAFARKSWQQLRQRSALAASHLSG